MRRDPGAVPSPALHRRPSARDPAPRWAASQSEEPLTRPLNARRNWRKHNSTWETRRASLSSYSTDIDWCCLKKRRPVHQLHQSWKWIKAQSNNWGHRPEHRFEFAGAVAIGDGAARNRRAIAGGVTGVHLRRLLENLNGGFGYVLQKRIQLLQRVCSDVQILKQGSHTSVNFKFKGFPGTTPSNPRT